MFNISDLASIIISVIEGYTIDLLINDKPFKECGIDSLELINIFLAIEIKYSIQIPDEDFNVLLTPKQLIDYVNIKISH
jgi:acyl carrier protein